LGLLRESQDNKSEKIGAGKMEWDPSAVPMLLRKGGYLARIMNITNNTAISHNTTVNTNTYLQHQHQQCCTCMFHHSRQLLQPPAFTPQATPTLHHPRVATTGAHVAPASAAGALMSTAPAAGLKNRVRFKTRSGKKRKSDAKRRAEALARDLAMARPGGDG
jgi:hypothetical protein